MARAFFSLGSNVGDRAAWLQLALDTVIRGETAWVSSVYETEPVGGVPQDDYWNMVVGIDTAATPPALLARAHDAEMAAGRVRDVRWGPRTLDVDVLLVEGVTSDDPVLTLPHPRMHERAFVLIPLAEIAPELVTPAQLAAAQGEVRALGTLQTLR